jgi:hypothetical protein
MLYVKININYQTMVAVCDNIGFNRYSNEFIDIFLSRLYMINICFGVDI